MATISNGESGSSVRTKLNEIINKVEGVTSINNDIDITGNVGIGTSSPSSYAKLHVDGGSGNNSQLFVTTTDNADVAAVVIAHDEGLQGGLTLSSDKTNSVAKITTNNSSLFPLVFEVRGSDGTNERMRIDSSGNLLVGTTELDLFSETSGGETGWAFRPDGRMYNSRDNGTNAVFNRLTSDGDILQFRKDGTTVGSIGTVNGDLTIYSSATSHGGIRFAQSGILGTDNSGAVSDATRDIGQTTYRWKDLYLSGGLRGDTTFKNNAGTTEYARFDSSGNLLVGKTSATSTSDTGIELRPEGTIIASRDGNDAAIFNRDTSDGNIAVFRKDGTTVGSISVTASATAYNTSSDYRLKENVVDLTGATTRLKQLEPKRFNFIADADTTVDGFLAHEVQTVVPEAITGTHNEVDADGNPVYQGIDQSKLVPLLVATIKELEARITALETN